MSTCSTCGKEMNEKARFCKSCGEHVLLADKKARVMTQEASWLKPTLITVVVVLTVIGIFMFKGFQNESMSGQPLFSPHRDGAARLANSVVVTPVGSTIAIPVNTVSDGNAHFYSYKTAGKAITFFVMKSDDGTIKTAFDACLACNHAKLGYRQEENMVVCNNCGMGFTPNDIGRTTGGCNPISIKNTADGQMVVLKTKDIEAGAQYF